MSEQHGEKTEKPSAKRVKDAREKGQVATRRDLSMALGSLAATGVLVSAGGYLVHRLTGHIADGLAHFASAPLREISPDDLVPLIRSGGLLLAMTVGPIAAVTAATGVLSSVVQTGFN